LGRLNEKDENSNSVCHGDDQDYGTLCHNFLTPTDGIKSSFKDSHIMTHLVGIIKRFISKAEEIRRIFSPKYLGLLVSLNHYTQAFMLAGIQTDL
jgi:hypothetical protein